MAGLESGRMAGETQNKNKPWPAASTASKLGTSWTYPVESVCPLEQFLLMAPDAGPSLTWRQRTGKYLAVTRPLSTFV